MLNAERTNGRRYSVVLFAYWLLSTLVSLVVLRSRLLIEVYYYDNIKIIKPRLFFLVVSYKCCQKEQIKRDYTHIVLIVCSVNFGLRLLCLCLSCCSEALELSSSSSDDGSIKKVIRTFCNSYFVILFALFGKF